jgi:O-antigen ligase
MIKMPSGVRGLPGLPARPDHESLIWAGAILAAPLVGLAVARGSLSAYIVLATLALTLASLLVVGHAGKVLVGWVVLEGFAFPFLRWPHYGTALITFDRAVLLACAGALLLTPARHAAKESRFLTRSLGLFALAFGLRAAFTEPLPLAPNANAVSPLQPGADWLDLVALPFVAFLAASRTLTSDRWPSMAKALTFLGVSVASLGLAEMLFGVSLAPLSGSAAFLDERSGVVRVTGPYSDPTAYGGVIVICLAATLYWMQATRRYFWGGAAVLIQILGLAPSYTKGVWGAAVVTFIIAFGLRRRFTSRTALVGLNVALGLGIAYMFFQSSAVVAARVTGEASTDNIFSRVGAYVQGFQIFQEWPWFGAGINQFVPAQHLLEPVIFRGVAATTSPHNTFLDVLAETGIAGFVPLLLVIWAIARVVRACRRRARTGEQVLFGASFLAAVTGYLLLSMPFTLLYSPPVTTILAIFLGAAVARLNQLDVLALTRPPASAMGAVVRPIRSARVGPAQTART